MCIIIYNLLSTCHMTDTKLLIFILSFNLYIIATHFMDEETEFE